MIDFTAARRHMVDGQLRPSRVTMAGLLDAMAELPREQFVPAKSRGIAYVDEDLALGGGRFLIEALTFARLVQAAAPQRHDTALDVGAATGYSTAVLARLAASVVALEPDQALADKAAATLKLLGIDNFQPVAGPMAEGHLKRAPYNVILINGAIDQAPDALLAQLAEGGRLATVVGTGPVGRATLFTKRRGVASSRVLFDAVVAPLKDFAKEPGFVF
ncbi:MAG: protein-L-isoaspartate O-methyltransferase [Alphaproteobacteria bacterium]|nr:protein-L-isoaspartate O-methyltransferase [Alphaproteobacteria bacterium]